MKNIVLIVVFVLCCAPAILHTENNPHLVLPKSIDLGMCPRGYEKAPHINSTLITITNSSDEDMYLINSSITSGYPATYIKFGYIFFTYGFPGIFSNPIVIQAKQSREFSVWFFSHSTGDTGAVEFNSKIIIRSRTSPTFPRLYKDTFADTLNIKATAVDSLSMYSDNIIYHEDRKCGVDFEELLFTKKLRARFFNNLSESVIIDSLFPIVSGNIDSLKISAINPTTFEEIAFPREIPSKGILMISVNYSILPYGDTKKTEVQGNFTTKNTGKKYSVSAYLSSKDTLLPEAFFHLRSNFIESIDGKQLKDDLSVVLTTCSSESVWFDSVSFTSDWEKEELKVTSGLIPIPILLEPGETYFYDITYTPKTRGRQFGFIKAYFHTNDGRQIVRTLDFQTYFPDSVSSVGEIREDNHTTPSLLITEPNLPLKLLGTYLDTPKLYDSYGNFIDLSTRLEQGYISLEGLSSGVYCFVFNSPAGMVSRKVLYVR